MADEINAAAAAENLRLRAWLERMAQIPYDPSGKYLHNMAKKALAGEVYEPPPPKPEMVCSKCGTPESFTPFGRLFDVNVEVCAGEEGYGDVTMMLCDKPECGEFIIEELKKLGFVDHNHGGTDLLADPNCVGDGSWTQPDGTHRNPCPTPTDPYNGTYIPGNYALSSGRVDPEGEDNED